VQVKKNLGRIKVTINKRGHIPQLGLGPIRRPVLITEELYNQLIKLGYPVRVIDNPSVKKTIDLKETNVSAFIPPVVDKEPEQQQEEQKEVVTEGTVEVHEEPAVSEEVAQEEEEQPVIETNEEKVIDTDEEEVEEILVDDPDLSAEAYYNEAFLSSKALCKKILSARQVQYEDSASLGLLKKLVMESNPEVEFVEE